MKRILESMKNKNLIPILIIFLFSLLIPIPLYRSGIVIGDDSNFHLADMYDTYMDFMSGDFFNVISTRIFSNVGYAERIFYAPLFHYSTVIIAYVFHNMGMSLITAVKINIVLNYFLGSLFMYFFALKVTKKNRIAALVAAIVYAVLPYKGLCAFKRSAYAEFSAMTFLPFIFSAAYDLIHMKEYKLRPFLNLSLGYALVLLSHTITAVFTAIFVVIYILLGFKEVLPNLKSKKFILSVLLCILLMLGLTAFYLIPLAYYLKTGIYIISDRTLMEGTFARILYNSWGITMECGLDFYSNVIYIVRFLLTSGLIVLIFYLTHLFRKKSIRKVYSCLMTFGILVAICASFLFQVYICVGCGIFFILYVLLYDLNEKREGKFSDCPEFISILCLFFIALFLAINPFYWFFMPGFLQNIQFCWRLYSFVSLFAAVLFALSIDVRGFSRVYKIIFASLILITFASSSGNLYYEFCYSGNQNVIYELDDSIFDSNTSGMGGWQKEYMPKIYSEKVEYESQYSNSLYYEIEDVLEMSSGANSVHLTPVVLEGVADITDSGESYGISVKEDNTLIQIPKVYLKGYQIYITDESGQVEKVQADSADYLVSFRLDKGNYTVKAVYEKPTVTKLGEIATIASLGAFVVLYVISFISFHKKKEEVTES